VNTLYTISGLQTIIQEIVNQEAWQNGNSLSLVIRGISTLPNQRKSVWGYEGNAGRAARLVITYRPA
jgi:hypothetical protein